MTTEVAPAPPTEAAARLDALTLDKDWCAKVLSGSGSQVRELHELIAKKSGVDKLDQIIAGTAAAPMLETVTGGALTIHNQMLAAQGLREAGLSDATIRQAFENKPVSKAEFDLVQRLHKERLGNAEWVARLLKNDAATRREFMAAMVVMNLGFEKEKAA